MDRKGWRDKLGGELHNGDTAHDLILIAQRDQRESAKQLAFAQAQNQHRLITHFATFMQRPHEQIRFEGIYVSQDHDVRQGLR
jgi:hypothetical protein